MVLDFLRSLGRIKLGVFLALSLFITGCAGTGVKGVGMLLPVIESEEQTAVFVVRQTGMTGVAQLVEVAVDGVVIGTIGNKEVVHTSLEPGDHSVTVRFTGIGGIGINKVMKTFSLSEGEKAFYTIKLKTGLLTNKLELIGVTKDTFVYSEGG